MTHTAAQPPRPAVWLLNLFLPAGGSQAILGDLLEEFSDLASSTNIPAARRWYWRQSIKTAAHLIGSGFRESPWVVLLAAIGGCLVPTLGFSLLWVGTRAAVFHLHSPGIIVVVQRSSYIFWLFWLGRVTLSLIVGCAVAYVAKNREMLAAAVLAIAQTALLFSRILTVVAEQWHLFSHNPGAWGASVIWALTEAIVIVIGAALVRMHRSATHSSEPTRTAGTA